MTLRLREVGHFGRRESNPKNSDNCVNREGRGQNMKKVSSWGASLALVFLLAGCGAVLAPRIGSGGYSKVTAWVDHRLSPKDYILLIGLSRSPGHHPMTVYIMRRQVKLMGRSLPRNTLVGIVVNPKRPKWMGRIYYQLPHQKHWRPLVSHTALSSSS